MKWPLMRRNNDVTVKLFNFVGTKFPCLTTLDIFVGTWIRRFQILGNIIKVNKYFVGILNSCIALAYKIHEF